MIRSRGYGQFSNHSTCAVINDLEFVAVPAVTITVIEDVGNFAHVFSITIQRSEHCGGPRTQVAIAIVALHAHVIGRAIVQNIEFNDGFSY